MALAEFQRLLLRLYTDRSLQELFYAGLLGEYEDRLSSREKNALRAISRPLLEQFQRSLAAKRMGMMRRRLKAMPRKIICSDFSYHGPILFFNTNGKTHTVPVSTGTILLARHLFESKNPLSLSALLRVYSEHGNIPLGAVIELGWILSRHRLTGRYTTCM